MALVGLIVLWQELKCAFFSNRVAAASSQMTGSKARGQARTRSDKEGEAKKPFLTKEPFERKYGQSCLIQSVRGYECKLWNLHVEFFAVEQAAHEVVAIHFADVGA